MKKSFKTIICLVLTFAMLFTTACSGNGGGGAVVSVMGRHMEVDVTPPIEGPFISFITQDGTIVAFDQMLQQKHSSTDNGRTWTGAPGPGYGAGHPLMVRDGALLPDGRLLVYLWGEGVTILSMDGSREHVPIARIDEAIAQSNDSVHVNVSVMEYLGSDRILISYTIMEMTMIGMGTPPQTNDDDDDDNEQVSGIMSGQNMNVYTVIYDISTGAVIAELPIENVSAVAVGRNYVYLLNLWEETIHTFNIVTGAASGNAIISLAGTGNHAGGMVIRGFGMGSATLAIGNDGNLLVVHNNSLLHITDSGTEIVLDGNAFSFGGPNSSVMGILPLANDSVILNVQENNQSYLYKYIWDPYAVINPDRTLLIWSLNNNDFVRATITELRRRYPDAYITYEVALTDGTAVSASDAIRTLNTRLLANNPPDILILDGTPVENYVDRGMLLDISDRLNTGDIFPTLLAPYRQANGAIYALPMQFKLPIIVGTPQTLQYVQTFEDIVNRIVTGNSPTPLDRMAFGGGGGIPEDQRAEMHFATLRELFDFMWPVSASAIINDNRLNSDALREFFAAILAISDMYNLGEPDMSGMFGMIMMSSGSGRGVIFPSSLIQFMSYNTNTAAFNVDNLMILSTFMRENAEVMAFPGMVSGAWLPSTIAGVSADTNVPDFAIEFMNAMLSPQVQSINVGEGLPVTRTALAEQIYEINYRHLQIDRDPLDIDIDAIIGGLTAPSLIEHALIDIIWGTVERLATRDLDLEGAVNEVEQNIRTYLAERS